jgi:hypothetical protein
VYSDAQQLKIMSLENTGAKRKVSTTYLQINFDLNLKP